MGTLSENINSTITSLEAIKQAVITKGGSVPTGTPLSDYASKILSMPAGEYTGVKSTSWLSCDLEQDNSSIYTTPTATTSTIPTVQWTINNKVATPNVSITGQSQFYWLENGYRNDHCPSTMGIGYANTVFYKFKTLSYANFSQSKPSMSMGFYSTTMQTLYRLLPVIYVPEDFIIESNTQIDILGQVNVGATSYSGTFEFKFRLWTQ